MTDQAATSPLKYLLILSAAFLVLFQSCKTVKNYTPGKPFVYEVNIALKGKFTGKEEKELLPQLQQQLHDSIRPRWERKFLIRNILRNPPAYDSLNADKSLVFMRGLLNSLGYYRDSITYDTTLRIVRKASGDQYRTTVNFTVVTADLFRFDSIVYNLKADTSGTETYSPVRDTLQQLTLRTLNETVVKKGEAFSTPVLAQEISRLSEVYRNNGFLRFSGEDMAVLWDTVGISLLRPTLDPVEQAQQLELLRRRRQNPTADIEFRLRNTSDSTRLTRYFIGDIRVYPDLAPNSTELWDPTYDTARGIQFISYEYRFRPRKLISFIYLKRGELYRQSNSIKTQNKFSSLPSWRLVSITPVVRPGQDTVDFDIKLTPAKQFQFSTNLESSRNLSNNPLLAGNLLGVGANLTLQNRNFARAANLAITNFRYGVELNASTSRSTIQTQQYSLSHTIQFPRRVPRRLPFSGENVRTLLGFNLAYTDRTDFYTVSSVNGSWGYEKTINNKLLSVRFPNIEYYALRRQQGLLDLINNNRSFRYIFNKGLILSSQANLSIAGGKGRVTNLLTFSGELAGLVASAFSNKFLDSNLYRFVRLDAEFRQTHRIRRSAFAWRVFGGLGFGLPRGGQDSLNYFLPFFRQYFAGGPNSMRAWPIRRLGPGSALKSFDEKTGAPDRFGDMRLEANAEYRFYIANLSGIILNGALFTDIGNVWFLRENRDFPEGEFRLSKLWKDLAIGAGTGLRVDFGFLKLRFDYAYKVKDPTPNNPSAQNKWFYQWQLNGGQFQLGIDYPF